MRKISEILLVIFTLILVCSGIFNSIAQSYQDDKDETILKLISRTQVINKYYDLSLSHQSCYNNTDRMANYKEYYATNTDPIIINITSYDQKISSNNLWSKLFLYLGIIGHVIIIFIESFTQKKKRGKKN
ncbi:hypothetical protein KAI32_00540 [Candidatus Pacearchaeota archaeon]|nr:hypothetical protein [Candidatus Pacearchaeota archaeon]